MSYIVFTEIIQVKYLLNTFPSLRSSPKRASTKAVVRV